MKSKFIFFILTMLIISTNVNAQTFESVDNSTKHLVSANEFYNNKKTGDYREFKAATLNIREKILYKDLELIVKKYADKYQLINIYNNKDSNIDPNRQIYFFCSIKETKEKVNHKFLIVDVETQELIAEGNGERYFH